VFALLFKNLILFILVGLWLMVLARVLLSFVNPSGRGAVSSFVFSTTEPLLAPVRRILPPTGMFDLSPMIVCLVIGVLLRAVA
jgi:YggT family protein